MFERMKAWIELVKLLKTVSPSVIRKEAYTFYRYHIIQALKKEGWFEFFKKPHTKEELIAKYGYTDFEADESYTGLSESDVSRHPDWRYDAVLRR